MSHRRALAALVALLLAGVGAFVSAASAATTVPGAPASCSAVDNGDGTYDVAWERPTDDGGGVIWAYALKVQGQADPVERLEAPDKTTEATARSYTWAYAVTGDPVVFQVRAINDLGFGDWCEAAVGAAPAPDPDPVQEFYLACPHVAAPVEGQAVTCVYELRDVVSDPDPSPTPDPDPTPTPDPSPTPDPDPTPTPDPSPTPDPDPTPTPDPDASLPYSAGSFFKSPVAGAPVNANRTTEFRNFMTTFPDQSGTAYPLVRGVGGNQWGTPFAVGKASDPVWKLSGSAPNSRSAFLGTEGFHAPEWLGDQLTGTSDSPFAVYDEAGGFTMMAANAKIVAPYTISASAWAVTYHDSNGLDYRNPLSDDDRNFTSRGRITDAMVIRRDVFDKALANGTGLGHVLHLFIAESNSSDGHVHPMTGHEGDKNGFGAEGERIRIKPGVNLEARGLSDFGLVIARTLQEHGAYIGDNSGGASGVKAEMSPNAWQGVSGVSANALQGLTWDDFEVVQAGWQ